MYCCSSIKYLSKLPLNAISIFFLASSLLFSSYRNSSIGTVSLFAELSGTIGIHPTLIPSITEIPNVSSLL